MKIGRNDPCPCGSGFKYKKCCGRTSTAPVEDYYDLSKRIAYTGEIGQLRRAFAESMMAASRDYNATVMSELLKAAEESKRDISCHAGCAQCCTQYIGATLQEVEAIVYYLYEQGDDAVRSFVTKYKGWRSKVGREPVFQQLDRAAPIALKAPDKGAGEEFLRLSRIYARLNIPCPFLSDGKCTIYLVRPTVCASVVSISPADFCSPENEFVPELMMPQQTVMDIPYFWGREGSLIYSNAPLLVHEVLHGGYAYLDGMPGLSGILDAAMSDPEIRTIVAKRI